MIKLPEVTDAEWYIMEALWKKSPLTIREVINLLPSDNNWSRTTVHTLFSRLEKKGAIRLVNKEPLKQYAPLIQENEYLSNRTKSFLNKTFGGSIRKMLLNFIEDEDLTNEDIDELKSILVNRNSSGK